MEKNEDQEREESKGEGKDYFSKIIYILAGLGSTVFFVSFLFLIFFNYVEPLELYGLIFLLMIGIFQFHTFFSGAYTIESEQKTFSKHNKVLTFLGGFVGVGLVFLIVYLYSSKLPLDSISLFWFPITLYLGTTGLYRWWMGRKSENMCPFLREWFKIEGLPAFIYSLGLLPLGLFFWDLKILFLLSGLILISGGISMILLGVWDKKK